MTDFNAQTQDDYAVRLAEVIKEKFEAAGLDPEGDLSDEDMGKAEELTKEAQDEVKAELKLI